jgi:hypothetical protein
MRCCYWFSLAGRAKWNSFALRKELAVNVVAWPAVINAIAIANVELILRAVTPNCLLDEAGKDRWIGRVELAGIDALSHGRNDLCASALLVAGRPIGMLGR